MKKKYTNYIDKFTSYYADRQWKNEKQKYISRSTGNVIFEMLFDRIAYFNYLLLIFVLFYISYIYMLDTTSSHPLKAIYMTDVHMIEKERDTRKSVLIAEKMTKDETNHLVHFVKVKYTSYKEKNRTDMIKAKKALQYVKSKAMNFEGDVFLRSKHPVMENGVEVPGKFTVDRFYSQKLDYDNRRKFLKADTPVRMHRGKDLIITGDSMISDMDVNKTKVTGNVKITIYGKKERF